MRRITVNVQRNHWSATFSTFSGQSSLSVGPWLLFGDEIGLLRMFERGRVAASEMQRYAETMRQWGVATVEMELTDEQYIQLLEAGIRDRRTGYQKLKGREARQSRSATRNHEDGV